MVITRAEERMKISGDGQPRQWLHNNVKAFYATELYT